MAYQMVQDHVTHDGHARKIKDHSFLPMMFMIFSFAV